MSDSIWVRYASPWWMRSYPLVLLLFGLAGCAASSVHSEHENGGDVAMEYVTKAKQAEAHLEYRQAIVWYERAAALGDARSMNELGWIYFGAHDIPGRELKDYPKARFWFEKAAGLRYTPAITQLGVMYSGDGSWGVPSDHAKAADLFLEAAGAGDPQAMNNVAVAYYRGDGVPENDYAAKQWWQRAVEQDRDGTSGKAAQSWLDLLDGKGLCVYCPPTTPVRK
jgi:TPR repeat protein